MINMATFSLAQDEELPASLTGFLKPGMMIRLSPRNNPSDLLHVSIFENEQYAIYKDALELPLADLAAKYPQVDAAFKKTSEQVAKQLAQLRKENPAEQYVEPVIQVAHESTKDCWTVVGSGNDYVLLKNDSEPSQKRVVAAHSIASIKWIRDLQLQYGISNGPRLTNATIEKIRSFGIPENADPKWVQFCESKLAKLDRNGDGMVTEDEWQANVGDFAKFDADSDGSVKLVEYYTVMRDRSNKPR